MTQAPPISELSHSVETPRSLARDAQPKNVASSLRDNFVWVFAGNVFYAACQWAILILLAKLASAEALGIFALGLAVTAPITQFANLQLGALQATDARRDYRFGHYLALRLVMATLALFSIIGIALGVGYTPVTATVVVAIGVAKIFEMMSDAYHGLLQQHFRMERVATSLFIKGGASVIGLGLLLWWGKGAVGAACGLAVIWGLVLAFYDFPSTGWLRRKEPTCDEISFAPIWHWNDIRRLAWEAFPIGVRVILLTLTFNVPRYFIAEYLGEKELGIFAALSYVTVVVCMLGNTLGQAAAPRLAKLYVVGDLPAYRRMVVKLAAIGALLGGAGVLFTYLGGQPLLRIMYGPEYSEHTLLFAWIMVGAALWCVTPMFVAAANAARRRTGQAVAGVLAVFATLLSSVLFVPKHDLFGAASAFVIGALVACMAHAVIFLAIGRDEHFAGRERSTAEAP